MAVALVKIVILAALVIPFLWTGYTHVEWREVGGKTRRDVSKAIRWWLGAFAAFFAGLVLLTAIVVIPGGHRGVVFSMGSGVQKRILPEGLSFIIPAVEMVHDYNVQRGTVAFSLGQGNAAASSDVQDVYVDVKVTYRPLPETVNVAWQEVGDRASLEEKILEPEVVQVLKAVIPQYVAQEVVTKREDIRQKTLDALNKRAVVDRYMEVFSVSVVNVEFKPEFRNLLEQKAQKTQELEIAKREVEIAGQRKAKAITEAQADSQSKQERARGEAYQNRVLARTVTARSLESRRVDVLQVLAGKWNGEFPTNWTNMSGTGAIPLPLLNVDALIKSGTK